MKHCLSVFLFSFFLVNLSCSYSTAHEETKMFKKSFQISESTSLKINTEFADVTIVEHNKNEIAFDVLAKVECKSESKAKKNIEKIHVAADLTNNQVHFKVDVDDMNNVNLDIACIIYMPSTVDFYGSMDYGDFVAKELKGVCDLSMDYGALSIGKLLNEKGKNILDLDYCSPAMIGVVKKAKITTTYGDLKIKGAGMIDLNSDYTDVDINKVIEAKIIMDYGDLSVQEVSDIRFDGDYVDVDFRLLRKRAEIDMDYGDLNINGFDSGFQTLIVSADYADVDLYMGDLNDFVIDANLDYGDANVPSFVRVKDLDYTSKRLFGGSGEAKFKISLDYGDLKIKK